MNNNAEDKLKYDDFGSLACLTYSMVLDMIGTHAILHEPQKKKVIFRKLSTRFGFEIDPGFNAENTLFVCDERGAFELFENHPDEFILMTVEKEVPQWVLDSKANVLVVRYLHHEALLQKLQNRLTSQRVLSQSLEIALSSKMALDLIVYEASDYLGGTPALNSRIGSSNIYKVGSLQASMLNSLSGSKTQEEDLEWITYKGQRYCLAQRKISCLGGNIDRLIVAYPDNPPTSGMLDALDIFTYWLKQSFPDKTTETILKKGNTHETLKKLINGVFVDRILLESFVSTHNLEERPNLRLLEVDTTNIDPQKISQLQTKISYAFPNMVTDLFVDGHYLFLLQQGMNDASLSNPIIERALKDHVLDEFDVKVSASQTYENLRDTHFAKRECELIFECSSFVDTASLFMGEEDISHNYYPFEDCILYILLNAESLDCSFKDFCLSHTPISIMLKEDLANGTNKVRILLMYQYYGHHANIVAEKLHMHRNTILYHIDKIQKRFGISLDDSKTMERIMIDAKMAIEQPTCAPSELERLLDPYKIEE